MVINMSLNNQSDLLVKTISIPMRDSVSLIADFFVKSDDLKYPVLLLRTPYSRQNAIVLIDAINLARSGWAVVVQNVRGRLGSEGCFLPFVQEEMDGADTIEWITKQLWCNGKVAMSGASYVGFVQWSCAQANLPGLKAISPQISSSNILKHWFYENETFRHAFAQSWGLSLAYTSIKNNQDVELINRYASNLGELYDFSPSDSPLQDLFKPYKYWLERENYAIWRNLPDFQKKLPNIPAFHLAGWFDIFCEGSLEDYTMLHDHLPEGYAKNSQRLIVGPWTHNELLSQISGEVDFGLKANGHVQEVMNEIHDWLFSALEEKPVKGGAKIFIMGRNEWQEFSTWPPREIAVNNMFLQNASNSTSTGYSLKKVVTAKCEAKFVYDPSNLPQIKGGRTLDPTLGGRAGSFNQAALTNRKDVLIFSSDILNKPVTIVGQVTIELNISSSREVIDIFLSLLDINPKGEIFNLSSATHRVKLKLNQVNKINLSVGSTAATFFEGRRICLMISSSNFPHVDRLLDKKQDIFENTIFSSHNNPSFISLPVVKPSFLPRLLSREVQS